MAYFVERKMTVSLFNLVQTMESGQAFCFERIPIGDNTKYFIISGSHTCFALGIQHGRSCELHLECSGEPEEVDYWGNFFGINLRGGMATSMADTVNKMLETKWPFARDYEKIRDIRLIQEDPWQALVASYMPDSWSVETRRQNMMRIVASAMRSSGLPSNRELWHFPSASEMLKIPMCAAPMQRVGPRLQKLCKAVVAKDINVYEWTRESGADHSEAVINLKFLTDHNFNTVIRTVVTGFHFDNLYAEECVNTAWLAQNMDEIRMFEKGLNGEQGGSDYSCISLLYLRIRHLVASKKREHEKFKLSAQKQRAAALRHVSEQRAAT